MAQQQSAGKHVRLPSANVSYFLPMGRKPKPKPATQHPRRRSVVDAYASKWASPVPEGQSFPHAGMTASSVPVETKGEGGGEPSMGARHSPRVQFTHQRGRSMAAPSTASPNQTLRLGWTARGLEREDLRSPTAHSPAPGSLTQHRRSQTAGNGVSTGKLRSYGRDVGRTMRNVGGVTELRESALPSLTETRTRRRPQPSVDLSPSGPMRPHAPNASVGQFHRNVEHLQEMGGLHRDVGILKQRLAVAEVERDTARAVSHRQINAHGMDTLAQENLQLRQVVDQLVQYDAERQRKMSEMAAELEQRSSTGESLQDAIRSLQRDKRNLDEVISQMREQVNDLTAKLNKMYKVENVLKQETSGLRLEMKKKTEDLKLMKDELHHRKTASDAAAQKRVHSDRDAAIIKVELAAANKALKKAKQTYEASSKLIVALKREKNQTQIALTDAQHTITDQENVIASLKKKAAGLVQKFTAEQEAVHARHSQTIGELRRDLSTQLKAMQAQLEEQTEARNSAEEQLMTTKRNLSQREQQLSEAQDALQDSQRTLGSEQEALTELRQLYKAMQERLTALQHEEASLRRNLSLEEDANKRLRSEVAVKSSAYDQAVEARDLKEQRLTEVTAQLRVAETKYTMANESVTKIKAGMIHAVQEKTRMEHELELLKKRHHDDIMSFRRDLKQLRARLQSQRGTIDTLKQKQRTSEKERLAAVRKLNQRLGRAESDGEQFVKDLRSSKARALQLQNDIARLKRLDSSTRTELAISERKYKEMAAQRAHSVEELKHARRELERLRVEAGTSSAQRDNVTQEVEDLKSAMHRKDTRMKDMTTELEALREQYAAAEKQLSLLTMQGDDLSKLAEQEGLSMSQLLVINTQLSAQLKSETASRTALEGKLADALEEIERLQELLQIARNELQALRDKEQRRKRAEMRPEVRKLQNVHRQVMSIVNSIGEEITKWASEEEGEVQLQKTVDAFVAKAKQLSASVPPL